MSGTAILERRPDRIESDHGRRPIRPESGRFAASSGESPKIPRGYGLPADAARHHRSHRTSGTSARSGWANSFYSAAVQAGTKSWKAFFFGSSDSSNFITVDKPPASLWVMELSARIFGLNSWSILVPQALEGVATVGLLYATVRRWFSPAAALIAGCVVALTPVAALMFRYNNPDALAALLLTASAYATVRAIERSGTRWLVLAGALVGFGFITKMLQAFLVVPALGMAYLLAAPAPLGGGSSTSSTAGSLWWSRRVGGSPPSSSPRQRTVRISAVRRTTASSDSSSVTTGSAGWTATRPEASQVRSRNGLERLGTDRNRPPVHLEIRRPDLLAHTRRLDLARGNVVDDQGRPRTDRTRAALVVFGGWLLVTGLVLSFAKGIIHPYYTVALAPAVGVLIGIGAAHMWRQRSFLVARVLLATALAATAVWSYVLLDRTPEWLAPLKFAVLVVGLVAASLLVVAPGLHGRSRFLMPELRLQGLVCR